MTVANRQQRDGVRARRGELKLQRLGLRGTEQNREVGSSETQNNMPAAHVRSEDKSRKTRGIGSFRP